MLFEIAEILLEFSDFLRVVGVGGEGSGRDLGDLFEFGAGVEMGVFLRK